MDFKPKDDFRNSQHAKPWGEVCDSATFRAAVTAAMLQMQANSEFTFDREKSASLDQRMQGARVFLSILMNLNSTTPEGKPLVKSANLDHNV
jgi:hypothetical protein